MNPSPPPETSPPPPTILIVEDDPLMARALVRILKDEYNVRTELSSAKARARLESGERFNVILSDVQMPGWTGVELYQWMQRECPDQAARVIFMTAGAHLEATRQFLGTIPERVIRKPFERHQLLEHIKAVLAQQRSSPREA